MMTIKGMRWPEGNHDHSGTVKAVLTTIGEIKEDKSAGGYVESGFRQIWDELPHKVIHSPGGFEWGYHGSGPADLAYNILLFVTKLEKLAEELYQAYKAEVVCYWGWGNNRGFKTSDREVWSWIAQQRLCPRQNKTVGEIHLN